MAEPEHEDEAEHYIPNLGNKHVCFDSDCADRNELALLRSFNWHCRPRRKDLAKGHVVQWTFIDLYFCDDCYAKILQRNRGYPPTLIGWDEWDAIDGLF